MKKTVVFALLIALVLSFHGVFATTNDTEAINIELSDAGILVNGEAATGDETSAVYVANDIVFYLAGQGFTYGEGTEADEHEQSEADAHTVVHITQPGTYSVSGTFSAGQIAIDLGKDAEEDPDAVVTLILNGVDISCTVAPAVIFYNVYECGEKDEETARYDVDTSAAGANVVIADGTVNNVKGSYVARIYKSYTLNEAGTEVIDNKKLHKYDAAFYSRMSMNVSGGELGDGVLNITAANEGLDSELHLTVNGGNINIDSGNDGINTNEDNISVTTINGGTLNINVNGATGEGDGIDSNGWLVINGGSVTAAGCGFSGDAGIDSDKGIYLNGGYVLATGSMFDHIAGGDATYAVFSFSSTQSGGNSYQLKNEANEVVFEWTPANNFIYLIASADNLVPGNYTLWQDDVQLAYGGTDVMGMGGMMDSFGGRAQDGQASGNGAAERPEGMNGTDPSQAQQSGGMDAFGSSGMQAPGGMQNMDPSRNSGNGMNMPQDGNASQAPGGNMMDGSYGGRMDFGGMGEGGQIAEFTINEGANTFSGVGAAMVETYAEPAAMPDSAVSL